MCILENAIYDMRIVMESTTEGLQKEQVKNDIKYATSRDSNEKVCRISEWCRSVLEKKRGEMITQKEKLEGGWKNRIWSY